MADKIQDLSGEAREKRIAELKRKMQEAAKKAQAAHSAGEDAPPGGAAAPKPAAPARQPAAAATTATAPAAATAVAKPAKSAAPVSGNGATNGATAPARPRPAAPPKPVAPETAPEEESALSTAEMNRREFLTYAWGAALGLLALESGVASFMFMYPRFRAGEFGGEFFISNAEIPAPTAAPQPNTTGKFWLVTTEEGTPKALYMVCTHLGCLYKWESSNGRFECPCHGSKFTHDGFYIEGPAPRSLDYFEINEGPDQDSIAVDTGSRITGDPASESPARAVPA